MYTFVNSAAPTFPKVNYINCSLLLAYDFSISVFLLVVHVICFYICSDQKNLYLCTSRYNICYKQNKDAASYLIKFKKYSRKSMPNLRKIPRVKDVASSGNRTRAARVAGEHSTTEPTMLDIIIDRIFILVSNKIFFALFLFTFSKMTLNALSRSNIPALK